MLKQLRQIFSITAILVLINVLFGACEVTSTGTSKWQPLPDLGKPKIGSNFDEGGKFRKALEDLAKIKIADDEMINIVVTFWDMAYFGGGMSANLVNTMILAPEPTDLYRFQPDREKSIAMLENAHVVFKIGYGLDDWVDPLIEEAKKENPDLVVVNLTRNIDLIGNEWNPDPYNKAKIKSWNPWFWLDPDNIMPVADTFYQVFFTFHPERDEDMRKGSDVLQHNMGIFPSSAQQMMGISGKIVIQDVPAWPYFAKYFDMTIYATLLEDGITEPDESKLMRLAKEAKENDVALIIKTNGYGNGIADKFSEMSGIPILELDPHPKMQDQGMTDYFQLVMGNTNRLLMKFRELGLPEQQIKPPEPEQPAAEIEMSPEDIEKLKKTVEEKEKGNTKPEEGTK
ncbi:metal ABC transporter substrate-binding protein [bacterium]|nr:metal ABC transporter substrate-binding protein [bacterium]MBU1025085.1 metal ABC transporter substrate-binding protein [bacterium]